MKKEYKNLTKEELEIYNMGWRDRGEKEVNDKKYNGWTNYATWRINLEILDSEGENLKENGEKFDSIRELADRLEETVDEAISGYGEIPEDSLAMNYANAFTSDVDYWEIAEHIVEDYPELLKKEDEEED